MKTTEQICTLIRAGGNVIVSAKKSSEDLCIIARIAANKGINVTIKGASKKGTDQLCTIARAGKGSVTFDLSE